MPRVIQIEAPEPWPEGSAVLNRFAVDPGESMRDVFSRLGVTARIEEVPAKPRTLSPEDKHFIDSYEYEDPGSVLAVFWRYHSLEAEEFDTVEEAESFLETGSEYGSLAGEAILDGDDVRVLD